MVSQTVGPAAVYLVSRDISCSPSDEAWLATLALSEDQSKWSTTSCRLHTRVTPGWATHSSDWSIKTRRESRVAVVVVVVMLSCDSQSLYLPILSIAN